MISTIGKNSTIMIPGMIKKCGMKIISSTTKMSAPKKRRPAISEIPIRIIRIGMIAPIDQFARLLKKCPTPEKKSPIPGKWISHPLCFRIHSIPKMMST